MFLHEGKKPTENISFLCSFLGYFNIAVNYVNAQALLKTVKACEETMNN